MLILKDYFHRFPSSYQLVVDNCYIYLISFMSHCISCHSFIETHRENRVHPWLSYDLKKRVQRQRRIFQIARQKMKAEFNGGKSFLFLLLSIYLPGRLFWRIIWWLAEENNQRRRGTVYTYTHAHIRIRIGFCSARATPGSSWRAARSV